MKKIIFIITLLFWINSKSQTYNPISISKIFSENEKYHIETTPFDDFYPSLRGKSLVFKNNKLKYKINRSFPMLWVGQTFLAVSNDGKYVIYIMSRNSSSEEAELKNVTIYKKGKLIKTFTIEEFTNCNPENETCNLIYDDLSKIIIYEKRKLKNNNTVEHEEHISQEEIFLCKNPVFILNDTIYSTNSNGITTVFDLANQKIIEKTEFSKVYPKLDLSDYKIKFEQKEMANL